MSTILGNPITLGGGGMNIKVAQELNDNSWAVIKLVADASKGANYWSVGDCKEVTLNGKVSDGLTLTNYSAWVYIIGFDHNSEREGTGITFQGFKATKNGTSIFLADSAYNSRKTSGAWFNMNNTGPNTGGWEACLMRKNIMPLIKAALPTDLQAVIKQSTIFTNNTGGDSPSEVLTATQDEVFLLAEYEVFGTTRKAAGQESAYLKQYAYYAAGNSKVKYKHNETSTASFWGERSPSATYSVRFCIVSTSGSADTMFGVYSTGVSPAFKV